jgi:putative endonuclease
MTNDLLARIYKHKKRLLPKAHSARYRKTKLVYFETHSDVEGAIEREKEIKKWPQIRKQRLVESINRGWLDLSAGWYDEATFDSTPPDIRDFFPRRRR